MPLLMSKSIFTGRVGSARVSFEQGGSYWEEYSDCRDGAAVRLGTIAGAGQSLGGHGVFTNDDDVDLATETWNFLRDFSL